MDKLQKISKQKFKRNKKKKLNIISVIPARAGSKGIKNKNMSLLNKRPLITYTFNALNKSKMKESYVLSDSKKIRNLARSYNINSKYIRPASVSKNTTSLSDTLFNFYLWTKKNSIYFDYLLILQPTSPLRQSKDINNAVNIIRKSKSKSLFSISESLEHPYEVIKIKGKKWSHIFKNSKKFYRRQDFNLNSFFINGAIYVIHRNLIKKKKIYDPKNHKFLMMPKKRSLEINDIDELKMVESIIKNL